MASDAHKKRKPSTNVAEKLDGDIGQKATHSAHKFPLFDRESIFHLAVSFVQLMSSLCAAANDDNGHFSVVPVVVGFGQSELEACYWHLEFVFHYEPSGACIEAGCVAVAASLFGSSDFSARSPHLRNV